MSTKPPPVSVQTAPEERAADHDLQPTVILDIGTFADESSTSNALAEGRPLPDELLGMYYHG